MRCVLAGGRCRGRARRAHLHEPGIAGVPAPDDAEVDDRLPDGGYFVILGRGGAGVGAAGEITNVTQVFQPSGRFSAANSL
jgi:hypothetical protein